MLRRIGGAAAIVIPAVLLWAFWPSRSEEPATFGIVKIDSPEVYTRERLVNDRFTQDAWLQWTLEQSKSRSATVQGYISTARERDLAVTGRVKVGESSGVNSAAQEATPAPVTSKIADQRTPELSRLTSFGEDLAFRDVVRAAILENQLDDRHDLRGNSLYGLKFDVAVLAGDNTRAPVRVTIQISGPSAIADAASLKSIHALSPTALARWEQVYDQWRSDLQARLNRTHSELVEAYRRDHFPSSYYDDLLRKIRVEGRMAPVPKRTAEELAGHRHLLDRGLSGGSDAHAAYKRTVRESICKLGAAPRSATTTGLPGSYTSVWSVPEPDQEAAAQGTTSTFDCSRDGDSLEQRMLDSFLAPKVLELVLGRTVRPGYTVREQLDKYLVVEVSPGAPSDDVFRVYPRTHVLRRFTAAEQSDPTLGAPALIEKKEVEVGNQAVSVSAEDWNQLDRLGAELAPQDIVAPDGDIEVKLGLLLFLRAVAGIRETYSYAVTPRESAEIFTTQGVAREAASLSAQIAASAAAKNADEALTLVEKHIAEFQGIERPPLVVGFGDRASDDRASFGWVIGPVAAVSSGGTRIFRQRRSQYALMAVISIPVWWGTVNIEAESDWLDVRGAPIQDDKRTVQKYEVRLPAAFEAIEGLLTGSMEGRPEVLETALDRIAVTVGRPAAILIPGRRLWRSTVVTLGAQRANSIFVLPDMKGIIAEFTEIQHPPGLRTDAKEVEVPVRVWTSQGSVTLPQPATVVRGDQAP